MRRLPPLAQPASSRQKLVNWLMMVAPGGAGHAHIQSKDQKRVQPDVQNGAAGDAHHGVGCAALKP